MNNFVKTFLKNNFVLIIFDIALTPLVFLSALLLKFARRIGLKRLKLSKKTLIKIGVMPILNHYYEPLFDDKHLFKPMSEDRELPGIDLNIEEQLDILDKFHFNDEICSINDEFTNDLNFHFKNGAFGSGDADFWYNIIRLKKPKRIIEIGSGHSTKIARLAIQKNIIEDDEYKCEHICIEPYEMPWLEQLGIKIIREKVENVSKNVFNELKENDILFIDSSHMIRPQGDVVFEYLELLPTINDGVIVHIHDIFTPKDYPYEWIIDDVKFWNEQYILEAFLTSNNNWKVIGSLNYLHHNYYGLLKNKCPKLSPDRNPGSFYIQKIIK